MATQDIDLYAANWQEIHPSALTPGMYIRYKEPSGAVYEGTVDAAPSKQPGRNSPWQCTLRTADTTHSRLKQLFLAHEAEVASFRKVTQ